MGLPWSAADEWLKRHAKPVLAAIALATIVSIILVPSLPLDFNPLHLQSSKSEAVGTFEELAKDPDNGVFSVDMLLPPERLQDAESHCGDHPEILRCLSLNDFVPEQQDNKLAILKDLSDLLGPTLNPPKVMPAPDAAELRKALDDAAGQLGDAPLAAKLRAVSAKDDAALMALQSAVIGQMPGMLQQLRDMLATQPLAAADLPPGLIANWQAKDGRKRMEIYPKEDMNIQKARVAFDKAVAAIGGDLPASGPPISIEESGKVVVHAFLQAGVSAVLAIFVLLWLLLRKVRDALLVMLPLVIGALFTVTACTVADLPINYANIISLPLLLGIGVAFNIYFVINWRYGLATPLQSPTTRAVLFSALTTGCAFGSLAVSPHLGTASMGLLLFVSLGLSVVTTFVLLPALFSVMKYDETPHYHGG